MIASRLARPVAIALCAGVLGAVPASGLANAAGAPAPASDRARAGVRVVDDPLEFEVAISTERASKVLRLFGGPWSDNHLVARIDRRSGAATFLVHQTAGYFDLQQRGFTTVHFPGPEGLARAEVVRVRDGPTTCIVPDGTAQCPFQETVTFKVDEHVLRWAAERPEPDWKFRFKARSGADRDAAMARSEVAALLAAVDQHRSASAARSAAAHPAHRRGDAPRIASVP